MLCSMTGYGRGEAHAGDITVVVELRSVNNRFRDLQLRLPRDYMALEPRINALLKEPFHRGRIDAFIRRSTVGSRSTVVADVALAHEYGMVINSLTQDMVGEREVPITFILSQPGVLSVTDAPVDVMGEWDVVETALQSAIADLVDMRQKEGKALEIDLLSHLEELELAIDDVESVSQGINERLRNRLEARIRRMVGDRFDPYRITQEVALLADKADVSEEVARLRSHCKQFAEAMDLVEPVGRRLDFLLQEMNREINTVGSKASEHPISHRVVNMKTVLERMREQSANIE